MVRRRPGHHGEIARVPLPLMIKDHHGSDILDVDFSYVNGCAFLHTKTRSIKFKSVKRCYSRGKKEILRGLAKVIDVYKARGLTISSICGDNEFEKIREGVQPIPVDIVAREEHVPRIERSIRTLKERVRCFCHSTPFEYLPLTMLLAVVEQVNNWLNQFPEHDGISNELSPAGIVLGIAKPDCNKLKITYGSYAQVYDSTDNTTNKRSVGAIALKPSNNLGGYFLCPLIVVAKSIAINGPNCQSHNK